MTVEETSKEELTRKRRINNMLRYKNLGTTIAIDLHNGYSVIAMALWNFNTSYEVTFYIKNNIIETFSLMEKFERIEFISDQKSIKQDITQYVSKLLQDGELKEYIDDYDYQMDCFDRGNGLYEDERSSKSCES